MQLLYKFLLPTFIDCSFMLCCCNYSFACLSCIRTFVHLSIQVSTFVILSHSRCELVSLSNKMKNLIFVVTWLYFQIMLVRCDIFVNNLNGSKAAIKMCIQKTINHLFSDNDTLYFILNDNDLCEDAIFGMSAMRPYIVLNMEMDAINTNKLQYDGQFIMCPRDEMSLSRAMHRASVIADGNNRGMGSSKILVITNTTNAPWMFKMFWYYNINNVIILVYGQGTSELLTCNRFAPENKCGRTQKLMIRQNCEEQLSLSFTSVIHQMNKCPITFWFDADAVYRYENHSTTRAVEYVVKELSHHLNATFQRTVIPNSQEYEYWAKNKGRILIGVAEGKMVGVSEVTEPLIIGDVLWFVPKAKQTSNMNVCLKIFTYHVWIATIVVFICVWLMWFLIISFNGGFTFDKLCISFLNVWSLTICGNVVSQLPRSLTLRILLLFYLIYAINMQFAFTSDMSTVLTAPQYGFQIRNLEELVDSQLPVYGLGEVKEVYFSENMTDRKLYTKLQNLIHVVTADTTDDIQYLCPLFDLNLHKNYAFAAYSGAIRELEILLNKKVEAYKIIDRSITPVYKIRLVLTIDHYFTTTLNTFVNRMIESGINEKRKNDFYNGRLFLVEKVDTTPQDDLITLKHLPFIFVFFGFGLGTACVVFCFELVLHKYL